MRAKWAIAIVVVCLVVMVAAIAYAAGRASAPEAAPDAVAEVIRAQRFELVDAEGKVRGALGMGRGQLVLAFADGGG